MYNRVIKAHVTAKANTDVFVGHGSIIVTVLSARWKSFDRMNAMEIHGKCSSIQVAHLPPLKSDSPLLKNSLFSSPKSRTRISCEMFVSSSLSCVSLLWKFFWTNEHLNCCSQSGMEACVSFQMLPGNRTSLSSPRFDRITSPFTNGRFAWSQAIFNVTLENDAVTFGESECLVYRLQCIAFWCESRENGWIDWTTFIVDNLECALRVFGHGNTWSSKDTVWCCKKKCLN